MRRIFQQELASALKVSVKQNSQLFFQTLLVSSRILKKLGKAFHVSPYRPISMREDGSLLSLPEPLAIL